MKINRSKLWTNEKHNIFHTAYYLDNFNFQDFTLWSGVQTSRLLDFSYNKYETQRRGALFWHSACSKAIKDQWLGISPFLKHHRTYCHFLIVLKTLASKNLPLLYHVQGPVLHRTWQDLSWSLLLFNCKLPCGVWIRHTSGFMARFQWRSLWAIQTSFSVWLTNNRNPSELWGWNAHRDELLIQFPNAGSTNQARAAVRVCKENLRYANLFNIAVLLVVFKKITVKYFLLPPVIINL